MRPGWRIAAAATLVGVPIVIAMIVFLVGGSVRACLGGTGCRLPPADPTLGLLGQDVTGLSVTALGVGWLLLAAVLARRLWRGDSRRLVRAAAAVVVVAGATGLSVAALRFAESMPRRTIAGDAAVYALGAAFIVAPLALACAVMTARRAAA